MAATEQFYRNQKSLDIVFAVSSAAMLVSIVAMFVQDYYRPWKPEQRNFTPVESALSLREAVAEVPSPEKIKAARAQLDSARDTRAKNQPRIEELNRELAQLAPQKLKKEGTAADVKSQLASLMSLRDIAVDDEGINSRNAVRLTEEVAKLQEQFAKAQAESEEITAQFKDKQRQRDALEKDVNQALSKLKSLNDDLIRRVRIAEKKQWGWGDWFLSLPVVDASSSPVKIHQFTINELPIDYNFKYVTRFDRCMTCHQGIDRPGFARDKIIGVTSLGKGEAKWNASMGRIKSILKRAKYHDADDNLVDSRRDFRKYVDESGIRSGTMNPVKITDSPAVNMEFNEALENLRDLIHYGDPEGNYGGKQRMLNELESEVTLIETQELLRDLKAEFKGTAEERNLPDPDGIMIARLDSGVLTPAHILEFSAHPRLGLFVGSNSKHPAEKFGCSICHGGQPSGTDFSFASHTPNNAPARGRWEKEHEWKSIHDWKYPMLPKRFMEASCLQCHHQVTDLITSENRNEAPTLIRGYTLIRENGCFGCHEIHGQKNGRPVGPDLRLEPTPPLESLSPADREKAVNDPDNPPGSLRKVGPSLYRLPEKTSKEWVARWIKAPREFRPDTRMPHYFGLSNNNEESLKGTGQEKFPDAEIASITHFLFEEARVYLEAVKKAQQVTPEQARKDEQDSAELNELLNNKIKLGQMSAEERERKKQDLAAVKARLELADAAGPLNLPALDAELKGDTFLGRKLFSERGCMACHVHNGTMSSLGQPGGEKFLPSMIGDAHFGPNLSQVAGKLLTGKGDNKAAAQAWLMQWLKNPWAHSPRSKMPITHLSDDEAQHLSAWLLSQPATDLGENWNSVKVDEPDRKTLEALTTVYLERILTKAELRAFFESKLHADRVQSLPVDEQALVQRLGKAAGDQAKEGEFKWYLGKKAVSRLGCFGCHSIPGLDNAKPIGTGLNDWGKKDPHKLAFEDIAAFIKDKYHVVNALADSKGQAVGAHEGKAPYEQFFADALTHHAREGFLYQKIKEPRSYDYLRDRKWDDRSRMPQFKFAHVAPLKDETPGAYKARAELEEAKAREAVMTFVLGLTADAIPLPYVNAPKPERQAEVRGRQVIDKFNCTGCHQIRPGFYDFKVTERGLDQLEVWHALAGRSQGLKGDYNFYNHTAWSGPLALGAGGKMPDRLQVQGVKPTLRKLTASLKDKKTKVDVIQLTLTSDLRWVTPKGEVKDIRAGDTVGLLASDLIYPTADALTSPEDFTRWEKAHGVAGGTFADLLTKYQLDYAPPKDPDERVDDGRQRATVPPILLREGERTQPDWLYSWLRDPTPVRKITLLRMPKFNLSEDEARTLVDYFAGVDRIQNPGIGLTYPYASIPQRNDFTEAYWQKQNAEYLARLKQYKDPDNAKRTLYDRRVEELKPFWEKYQQSQAKEVAAKLDVTKDADAKKALQAELARLKTAIDSKDVKKLEEEWQKEQVYFSDGFRLVGKICTQCHQLGDVKLDPKQVQGPRLDLAWQRLRPEWTQRWIAHPQRFLTYTSSMPVNFPSDDRTKWEQYFAGEPLDRITAVRDLLMIYPRVAELPINRYWLQLEAQGEKK